MTIDYTNRKTIKITGALAIAGMLCVLFTGSDFNEPLNILDILSINIISLMVIVIFAVILVLTLCTLFWGNKNNAK